MRYLSVCSGIEAATVAWHPLGWQPVGFSEIEAFPSAVLAHHYPNVPNFGDMTNYKEWDLGAIDLLVGGTPCQSFSVAGLRKGLEDPRGNLALVYCGILDHFRPNWCLWENVPGVLSSNGGRDFGSFLGALAELGYGFAYRVLDAQYFGVAQRRRRVFVVGYLGDWRPAAEVLFEPESVRGDPAPSREARQEVAGTIAARFGISRNNHEECVPAVAGSLDTECGGGKLTHQSVANGHLIGTLTARMVNALGPRDIEQGAIMAVTKPIALAENTIGRQPQNGGNGDGFTEGGPMYTLNATGVHGVAQSIGWSEELTASVELAGTLQYGGQGGRHDGVMQANMAVRRLTPVECERLQGFPDNYTNIPWRKAIDSPDGPRYKALGNSMAVPVMKWIGERLELQMPKLAG
jgi:DNA (cytosine-5)-methyltransferase 1